MKKTVATVMLVVMFLLVPATNMTVLAEDGKVVELYALPINGFYSQGSDSPATVYEEANGNQYLKLAYKNSNYTSFYFDITKVIDQDGIYKFEADIRYNGDFETDNVFMTIFSDSEAMTQTIATDGKALNSMVSPIKNSSWKKLSVIFTMEDFYLKGYEYLKFGFNTMGLEKNYMDMDNISITRCSEMTFGTKNIDTGKNGDFQAFEDEYDFGEEGWHAAETYYANGDASDNEIVSFGNNRVLKMFTSTGASTTITKALNLAVSKSGWYKLSFKAKAGANFYTDNIGFRISDETGNGAHVGETIMPFSAINKEDWVTIEAPFYVNHNSSSPWINLDLWVFTHNDNVEHQSDNNYLLIDDIQIMKKASGGEWSENLFAKGNISGFKESQGQKVENVVYGELIKKYPYVKHVIDIHALEQFETGKKLMTNCVEQDWWGTVSEDIGAEMVDIDGYHAALLTHDGKQVTKTFSSLSYVFNFVEFSTQKYYTLDFDYKIDIEDTDVIRVAFIGSENLDDYMINLVEATTGVNYTEGVNKDLYSYVIEEKEDGWCHLRLIFKPNIDFKSRVTTLRFLNQTNFNQNNKFYVANIELTEYSDTEYPAYALDNNQETKAVAQDSVIGIIGIVGIALTLLVIGAIVIGQKRKESGSDKNEK